MRCSSLVALRQFLTGGDQNGLRHALVKGHDGMALAAIRTGIVKDANDGGIAPLQNSHDAAETTTVGLWRFDLDEDLIALHGAVDLARWNEDIFLANRLMGIGTDKTITVAMQVESASSQILTRAIRRGKGLGNAPVLPIELYHLTAHREASQVLKQQPTFSSASKAQFANQLLISCLLSGRASDARQKFFIRHSSRVQ